MKFVALLLSLLLAITPTRAWAAGSYVSAAVGGAGGRPAAPTERRTTAVAGGSTAARPAIGQTPPARPVDAARGSGSERTDRTADTGRLSPARVTSEFGIPARNQQAFQNYADRRGLVIDVRPTNPASLQWLNKGALPKPEAIKAKTVDSHDLMLNRNLPHDSRGLVALFKPVMPQRPRNMSDHEWSSLGARYAQRLDEWHKLSPVIGKGDQEGRYRVTSSGRIEGLDGKGTWRSITGDHDVFEIRRVDGSRLSRREEDALIREMKDRNMGVQHGAHVSWNPPAGSWERTKIFDKIIQGHQPGGEALIRFAPGKEPRRAWASSPVHE